MPPPGDLPNPRIGTTSLESPALAGRLSTTVPLGKTFLKILFNLYSSYLLSAPLQSHVYFKLGKSPSTVSVCESSVVSVVSDSVQPHRRQPTRLPCPWDSPGKNTGVGCHFFFQCMKVKSESEVAQSCPTLSDPMDCSLPGSSVRGIFQPRVLEWAAISISS